MDKYGVPHKVNRHVLKAVRLLCEEDCDKVVHLHEVIEEVKLSTRNLAAVSHIELKVWESLCNLSAEQLLEQKGMRTFSLPRVKSLTSLKCPAEKVDEGNDSKRRMIEKHSKNTKNSSKND